MNNLNNIITVCIFFCCICCAINANIITYPIPKDMYYARHNDEFTVKIRQVGDKNWIDLYEYNMKVDLDTKSDATMVQFEFSGKIEISIQKNNGEVNCAIARPLSKNIKPDIKGNTITFIIDRPEKLSVEFNDDRLHNLHIFANAIRDDAPDKNASNVMYFDAGIHEAKDKVFRIPSNTTVYLEGGAVLKAKLVCDSVENVKILGNGMILESENGIGINYCKNVLVDGVTIVDPRYNSVCVGQSKDVTLRNIKSFSYQGWGDGLDFYCCKNIIVEDIFMRNSDDCIAIYNHRWNYWGNSSNLQVSNAILWADIAHPIVIGTHGNTETQDEVFENITFQNIDILEEDEDDREYEGCMTINVGDHNLARDIHFENIRVEHIQEGELFHLRVMFNQKYNTGAGKGIENVTFKNISYSGHNENPIVIHGYDAQRMVKNIQFENIVINGEKIKNIENLNADINKYTSNITLK